MGFVVDRVVLEQILLRIFPFSPVSAIPAKLHAHRRCMILAFDSDVRQNTDFFLCH